MLGWNTLGTRRNLFTEWAEGDTPWDTEWLCTALYHDTVTAAAVLHISRADYGIFSILETYIFGSLPKMEGRKFHKWKVHIGFPKMGTPLPEMEMPPNHLLMHNTSIKQRINV